MYYNYHAKAISLIKKGHLTHYEFVENHNGICPALVLHFDNHSPMPIREYKWFLYQELLNF